MTVVVVTHDLDSIFTIGNNSVFLDAVTHTMITGAIPMSFAAIRRTPTSSVS